jgi:hypothetical protein
LPVVRVQPQEQLFDAIRNRVNTHSHGSGNFTVGGVFRQPYRDFPLLWRQSLIAQRIDADKVIE